MNLVAYVFMCVDKYQSKIRAFRIPERFLIFMALAGGGVGILAGMSAPLYHKSSKLKFRFIVPISVIMTVVAVVFLMISKRT